MIRFIVCDADGNIRCSGFSATLRAAFIQASAGERVFALEDFGLVDAATLRVDFNNMLIVVRDGVTVPVQGENTPIIEITSETRDA